MLVDVDVANSSNFNRDLDDRQLEAQRMRLLNNYNDANRIQ